jgi:exodeoxyribonuclease VII small subunit
VTTNLTQEPIQEIIPLSFEAAFARLEEILEKLNTGTISLDDSLKLYEEADQLIVTCNKRLNDAERKIEILVKNRNGELVLGNDEKPLTQDYKVFST